MAVPTSTGQVSSTSDADSTKLEPQPVQETIPSAQPGPQSTDASNSSPKRGLRFWLIFLAVGCALFLSPLELVREMLLFLNKCSYSP